MKFSFYQGYVGPVDLDFVASRVGDRSKSREKVKSLVHVRVIIPAESEAKRGFERRKRGSTALFGIKLMIRALPGGALYLIKWA